ncbi:DUF4145 domain-containing protein [Aliifodinibius sp. S!AR15-10]|uniref:DUF4145 domain-containing protein n=1 Tax=Aliifodinibius sp. S!AR15-10 TaxID=2950437 RepID=UPI0028591C00|nr:DUF4145 domain-containing protein [Aliifodinibius sp. S!AR15-10]MDR8394445.1 DUF4145 domain-containing protein [Aliifodinibius sp. S!AR15-10]
MSFEKKLNKNAGKIIQIGCISCSNETNHEILSSVELEGSEPIEPNFDIWWSQESQILQCKGCDSITFRQISSNSEDTEFNGRPRKHEELFPNRSEGRDPMDDEHLLPSSLHRIYMETISALNNKQPVLAGIGIRAIIETVTKDKDAQGNNLKQKIDGLVDQGSLTEDGSKTLHKLRVLGNESAHEVKAHEPKELNLAFDVVDHLLKAVYIIPHHASQTFK